MTTVRRERIVQTEGAPAYRLAVIVHDDENTVAVVAYNPDAHTGEVRPQLIELAEHDLEWLVQALQAAWSERRDRSWARERDKP